MVKRSRLGLSSSIPSNLVGWWKFNEGPGLVAQDYSGNGNHGQIIGATYLSSGNGLQFDGIDDYVLFLNSASLNPVSITIIIKLYIDTDLDCDANNNWRSLIHKGGTAGGNAGYDVVLEQYRNIAWDTGFAATYDRWWPSVTLPLTNWAYFAVSWNAITGEKRVYLNDLKWTKTISADSIASNVQNLYINNPSVLCPNGNGNAPCKIGEVRIYNTELTDTDHTKIYNEIMT